MKDYLILNGIKLTKFLYCLSKRHGLCTWNTPFQNKIISLRLKKTAAFRVKTKLTENLVGLRRTIMETLLSEQFSTHFGACCVVTRSILKPTDAITKEYRQELYEMQFFGQILHISGSVKWPLSYKNNLLDMELFPWEYPMNYTLQN